MQHSWDLTPKEAISLQKELATKINLKPLATDKINLIGGADISANKKSNEVYAGIIILNAETLQIVDKVTIITEVKFPYIPGLLSFREVPPLIKCWQSLKTKPDVLILDGHGIAHPRRFGLACHFGLYLNIPTIGCAKNRLVGEYDEPEKDYGSFSVLKENDEQLGSVYRSRTNVNLFSSLRDT